MIKSRNIEQCKEILCVSNGNLLSLESIGKKPIDKSSSVDNDNFIPKSSPLKKNVSKTLDSMNNGSLSSLNVQLKLLVSPASLETTVDSTNSILAMNVAISNKNPASSEDFISNDLND